MPAPLVSLADLQRVHRELHVTVPLDQASPLILATLAVVAHCWGKKLTATPPAESKHRIQSAIRTNDPAQQFIDLKRRAAGDND